VKFSVIIPTYNRSNYIIEAVDSALQQQLPPFEVLIVDDGSTDNTGELVQSQYAGNPVVKYFYKTNEERGAARNFGMQKATGDYAVFFDSDDWMLPGYLKALNEVILKQKPALLATRFKFRNDKGREWNSDLYTINEGWYPLDFFLRGNWLACNYAVRLDTPGLQLFPPQRELASMEDWLFLLLNLKDKQIYISSAEGVVMREHDNRSMANNRNVIEARKRATAWALEHLSLSPAQQNALQAWSAYFCGIHEYLEGNRSEALKQASKAIRFGGPRLLFLLLHAKALVGKKLIERLKK
jgi:glycosyltransferase involved in cell wall biosynthesis